MTTNVMDDSAMVETLNKRANKLGYEVVDAEAPTGSMRMNLGRGPWVHLLKDGERRFKFAWRAEEVQIWLYYREREAR